MAKTGSYQPIDTLPGVQPETDMTAVKTKHFTYSDKIRFINGVAEKIGGWLAILFDYSETILGTIRSIFSLTISGRLYTLLGTNKRLYALFGSTLTNITPLDTDTIAIADSLDTHYATLANDPISTTDGSAFVTIADTEAGLFQVGDTVTLSGATGFAGILAGAFNTDHIIREIGVNVYTINVGTAANATTSGGGASVVRSSGLLTVNDTAHGQIDGDRVKISGAATTGGILDTEINVEHIIRNVTNNTFDVMTSGTASSSVTGGGGAGTEYQQQIPAGALDETNMTGYGAGLYGAGLYGTALVSSSTRELPRIWYFDRYANTVVMTPGNQTGVYQWLGDTDVAPELVANAPTEVNYVFVSNNILVTFGASDMGTEVENRIFASDQNDIENWTSSSTNQVFDDNVEGAGRLLSHLPVGDRNLIFTENQTYTFRYIGLPFVWEIQNIEPSIGIIAPMARVSVKGTGYWMGQNNFYMYRGGDVEIIPANSQAQSTCLKYVFDDLNWAQKSKIFAWYNNAFSEVWFHYPSGASLECDRAVVVNLLDNTWVPHVLSRTAAEYPVANLKVPRLANTNLFYQHEVGKNDDTSPMAFTLTSNKRYYGRDNANLNTIIPDSIQDGTIKFTNNGYLWPQSPTSNNPQNLDVNATTLNIPVLDSARFHQYTWYGNELDQDWMMGEWIEEIQKGPTN